MANQLPTIAPEGHKSEFEVLMDMTRGQSQSHWQDSLFTMGPFHLKLSMSDGLTRPIYIFS